MRAQVVRARSWGRGHPRQIRAYASARAGAAPAGQAPQLTSQATLQAEELDPQTAAQASQQETPQRIDSCGPRQAVNNGSHPAESHGSPLPSPDDRVPQQPHSDPAATAQAQNPSSLADTGPADASVPSPKLTRSRSRVREHTIAHTAASQALAASTARAQVKGSAKTSKPSGKNSSLPQSQPASLPPGPSQDQRSALSSRRR